MYETLQGNCSFSIADPEFSMLFECQRLGQVDVTVDLSANLIRERHSFKYELDQSYLPPVIQTLFSYLENPPMIMVKLNDEVQNNCPPSPEARSICKAAQSRLLIPEVR